MHVHFVVVNYLLLLNRLISYAYKISKERVLFSSMFHRMNGVADVLVLGDFPAVVPRSVDHARGLQHR